MSLSEVSKSPMCEEHKCKKKREKNPSKTGLTHKLYDYGHKIWITS